eukprot:scaffold72851_cov19-Tisochrysis_lutea.AAC.6
MVATLQRSVHHGGFTEEECAANGKGAAPQKSVRQMARELHRRGACGNDKRLHCRRVQQMARELHRRGACGNDKRLHCRKVCSKWQGGSTADECAAMTRGHQVCQCPQTASTGQA